ncbi:13567_t:CDS:2 [Ambispora gerdemannii]|uniref:13567_t:CDS:1 n=1 Tax=Ambispora gerdemannii TaxID=144530 RepID=A0A9N9BT60_9GLOM|nr:13567_t:CDS:2 [Ambispora gerdemannii]
MAVAPEFVDAEELAKLIKDKSKVPGKDYVVIDVREDDFEGGNIPGCVNVPSSVFVDNLHQMIKGYSQVPQIIFHCALSQVRGPKSARIYQEALTLNSIKTNQKILILSGGFVEWQKRYKSDAELVEKYNEKFWMYFEF